MYGKAGATSIGDYLGRHADSIRERVKNEEFERDIYKDIGNYLHITADSSIRAALVVEGEPFHGEAAMEVGHHAVLPAKIDQEHRDRLSCPAHPQRPCLNSLASLPAIKRRWKELENTAFKDIKDTEKVSLVSWYISQMVSNVILSTSPAKVVVGGRIADNQKFLELLRKHVFYLLMDREYPGEVYPGYTELQDMEDFISWQTDKDAGVKGGIYLLFRLLLKERKIVDLNKAKQVWPL
jgi:fructokinase